MLALADPVEDDAPAGLHHEDLAAVEDHRVTRDVLGTALGEDGDLDPAVAPGEGVVPAAGRQQDQAREERQMVKGWMPAHGRPRVIVLRI